MKQRSRRRQPNCWSPPHEERPLLPRAPVRCRLRDGGGNRTAGHGCASTTPGVKERWRLASRGSTATLPGRFADAQLSHCVGIAAEDRAVSPFLHTADLAAVAPLQGSATSSRGAAGRLEGATVTIRAVKGLTAEWPAAGRRLPRERRSLELRPRERAGFWSRCAGRGEGTPSPTAGFLRQSVALSIRSRGRYSWCADPIAVVA